MKKIVVLLLLFGLILLFFALRKNNTPDNKDEQTDSMHIYASWDIIEYDQCVAVWLIKRFYDTEARFVFYPSGTEITEGIVFDVPGAAWSRQHRRCTSDCILEALDIEDPIVSRIVEMAHHAELNFWQLDSFPNAQKSVQEVMVLLNEGKEKDQFLNEIMSYFDQLYMKLK